MVDQVMIHPVDGFLVGDGFLAHPNFISEYV